MSFIRLTQTAPNLAPIYSPPDACTSAIGHRLTQMLKCPSGMRWSDMPLIRWRKCLKPLPRRLMCNSLRGRTRTIVRSALLVANRGRLRLRHRGGWVSRLYLLRHAKAGWALPGMRDFDRPLDASGRADAEIMGTAMRSRGYIPDLTLC